MKERMGERKEVWMKGRINERRNERKDEWKKDEYMNEWINRKFLHIWNYEYNAEHSLSKLWVRVFSGFEIFI